MGTAIGVVPLIVLVMEAGEGSHRIGDKQVDALAGMPGSGRQSSRSLGQGTVIAKGRLVGQQTGSNLSM